ncbi:Ca2+/Na+ antiporter [Staphylococcus simulans]|uniref:hypothetical protein n=1 Tax=Staphylococcus simulans TaxID=1286 RepID=UPI0030C0CFE8
MVKKKVNIHSIIPKDFNSTNEQKIKEKVKKIDKIDRFSPFITILLIVVLNLVEKVYIGYLNISVSIIMIAIACYMILARQYAKREIESILREKENNNGIKVINNNEKLSILILCIFPIVACFSIISTILSMWFK